MTLPDPIICVCAQVTEDEICATIRGGATDVRAVRERCGANAGCGSCVEDIQELLEDVLGPLGASPSFRDLAEGPLPKQGGEPV